MKAQKEGELGPHGCREGEERRSSGRAVWICKGETGQEAGGALAHQRTTLGHAGGAAGSAGPLAPARTSKALISTQDLGL